jgi:hypothetical protein
MEYETETETRSDADKNSYFSKKDHFTVKLINSSPRNQAGAQ